LDRRIWRDIEDVHNSAFALVRDKKYREARQLLETEAANCRKADQLSDAGHLSITLAATCFMVGDLQSAVAAYRQAITDDPANFFHRQFLARFLLSELNDPQAAFVELEAARPLMPTDLPTAPHNFEGLNASTLFALGRTEEALAAFRKMSDPAIVTRMYSQGLETDIAYRLCHAHVAISEVRAYLQLVLGQAEKHHDSEKAAYVTNLLSNCTAE
jgi:tetratricopeptide (TPR) repeat protein